MYSGKVAAELAIVGTPFPAIFAFDKTMRVAGEGMRVIAWVKDELQ